MFLWDPIKIGLAIYIKLVTLLHDTRTKLQCKSNTQLHSHRWDEYKE